MAVMTRRLPLAPPRTRARSAASRLPLYLLALIAGALATLALPAAPASAHAVLASSNPSGNAVLQAAPVEVVLTFTESVRKVPDRVRVIGPDGKRVDQGDARFDGAVVTIPVEQTGAQGTYLVSYRVISADSHPVSGGFTYSVGAPSTTPSGDAVDEEGDDPVVATGTKVVRYIGYAGLVLLVGPVLVISLLWPARLSRSGPAGVIWTGMGLVTLATLAGIWLQVPYTTGGGLFDVDGSGLRNVLSSTYGTAHLIRLGLIVAIALLLRPLLRGETGRVDQILLAVLGGAAIFTWPVAGHPAASPVAAVSVVVDAVHLTSMAVWLGGLVMLIAFLLRQANTRELGAILPIWSRWAALAVGALVLAGTVQALIEVGTPGALVSTTYGQLIIAKVVLFGAVIAVASYSRRLVLRGLAPQEPRRLRRAVGVELGITVVVLGLAAVLVQTTPARTAAANEELGGPGYYTATLDSNLFKLQVDVDPARKGNNSVHLYAYDKDNKPLPVVEWTGAAALPANDVAPVDIPLLPLTPNHATGEITLPLEGDWELRFTVRISEIDQATVTATVPVK
ncbi:copper resistance CopC/CopD family protein [Phytohabitans suffuscus]|uniref:Transport integral membrane protein n=1 Tax=Phytohabitans suffuscus TaxID=624315 RepID=A0A6F8YFR4_9ACTN|nr:copper resistance protein CopC [Phytohabitans suffuscus]BCB84910.1 transport integral membrane protein [Phytohabitans suffuscus]